MTTAIAAGNGAMSGGRYRGFARPKSARAGCGGGGVMGASPNGTFWVACSGCWRMIAGRLLVCVFSTSALAAILISRGSTIRFVWLPKRWRTRRAGGGRSGQPQPKPSLPSTPPSVLTVGGVDDGDSALTPLPRTQRTQRPGALSPQFWRCAQRRRVRQSRNLLAPAAWIPGPFANTQCCGKPTLSNRLRRTFRGDDDTLSPSSAPDALVSHSLHVITGQ